MDEREPQIAAFLRAAGWPATQRRMLAADASFRRYHRLLRKGESAVLMDAPPPHEDVTAYDRVARLLADLGFSAPRPMHVDRASGLMLLEDLGDHTFTRALATGSDESALYALAVDVLIALHRRFEPASPAAAFLPPYDETRLLEEAVLLVDWTLPALRGRRSDRGLRESYLAAWREVLPAARRVPDTLVLRDYHVDNLMVIEGREGLAACGLLDFQDAVTGPLTYDMVSLLEDARRDVSQAVLSASLERYLAAFPRLDRNDYLTSYAVLGAQRNAKIIGIFTRLWRRDGKPQYLRHIPRVWRLLEGDLMHPILAPVRNWFDREIPPEERVAPQPGTPA